MLKKNDKIALAAPAEHNPLSRGASLNEFAVIIQLCMKLM